MPKAFVKLPVASILSQITLLVLVLLSPLSSSSSSPTLWSVTAYSILYHHHHPRHQKLRQSHFPPSRMTPPRDNQYGNNDQEDEEEEEDVCVGGGNDDEEECEIDWSKMPGFDSHADDDEIRARLERQFQLPSTISTTTSTTTATTTTSTTTSTTTATTTAESTRAARSDFARLEMLWQQREESTECNVDEPVTCGGETCPTCAGTGHSTCRFCRGTKFLYLPITQSTIMGSQPNDDTNVVDNARAATTKPTPSKNSSYVSCSICQTTGTEVCRTCQGSGWIAHWTQLGVRVGDQLH